MLTVILGATEYNYNCIGKYTDNIGGNFKTAPFDGNLKTYIAWTDEQSDSDCGIIINFYKTLKITQVMITTDSDVRNIAPSVEIWDIEKFIWIPFANKSKWQETTGRGGNNIFTLEELSGQQTCAVRIIHTKQRFPIYECAVWGKDKNGNDKLLTPTLASNKSAKEKQLIIIPDKSRDLVTGNKRMTLWQPGGISGKFSAVGLCNGTPRNDRVLMRLNCSQLIERGKIQKAELFFVAELCGNLSHPFSLEYIENDNPELTKNDLAYDRIIEVACFVSDNMKYPQEFKLDLTDIINMALSKGAGICKFRFRDIKADKLGNPQRITNSIMLSNIKLVIIP